ncbi:MAG: hypothetical protein HN849_20485 [Victivallales bacterium]|nr:hypothetical protein [Victivallales bacterium]
MPLGLNDNELELSESEVSDITFASAEARFALLRARLLRLVMHIAAMAVVLLASTAFSVVVHVRGVDKVFEDPLGGGSSDVPPVDIDPIGSEDAKVQIVAVLPGGSDCHSGVAKLLSDIATARPEEIHVKFVSVDDFSKEEPDLQVKIGQPCAAIVINEEVDFKFLVGGKIETVHLVGNEPANYKMSDVGDAITQVHRKHYGDPGEPIYTLETKGCGKGEGGGEGAKCGEDHTGEEKTTNVPPREVPQDPIKVELPGKLPPIKGLR